ncbi:Ferric siderophore transport system, periplasmic binding protein TonB [Minicystis rosea]|nr:Ferric siderophore transport system, periplasmic binding protein TonB [Minicystis rosea]
MARVSMIYGVSLVVHAGLAVGVASLRKTERRESIAISVSEGKKKEKAPEPAKVVEDPKPTEAKTEAPRREMKAKAAPKAEAPKNDAPAKPSSPVLDALPDFGLSLGNGGPGGIAVPQPGAAAPAPSAVAATEKPAPKTLAPKPADACEEPPVKPKPRGVTQPAYTTAAREANVEGKVRVEVSVAADGSVTSARVLAGLGYGLDEKALEAARRATFEPGTRCGKAVAATFVIAFRFTL